MKIKFILILLVILSFAEVKGQDYFLKEYAEENANLGTYFMQETLDGNFIITTQKDCYTPGGISIEGCPISRTLIKIDAIGDTIWTSDLSLWHNSTHEMFEGTDSSFYFLTSQPTNFTCVDISVGLFGFQRTSVLKLSSTGQRLETIVFNDECHSRIIDYVKLENEDIILLVEAHDENFSYETQLIHLDNEFTIKRISVVADRASAKKLLLTPQENIYIAEMNYTDDLINLYEVDTLGNVLNSIEVVDFVDISWIKSMIITSDGDLLISMATRDLNNNNAEYLTLVKKSFNGTLRWIKRIDETLNGFVMENSNQEIILGTSMENLNTNSEDIFLKFYSLDGDSLGTKT